MSEKHISSDDVAMGIDKYMVASLCRLWGNAINRSLVSIPSVTWIYHLLAAKELAIHFPLCAGQEQWLPSQIQFLPMI